MCKIDCVGLVDEGKVVMLTEKKKRHGQMETVTAQYATFWNMVLEFALHAMEVTIEKQVLKKCKKSVRLCLASCRGYWRVES